MRTPRTSILSQFIADLNYERVNETTNLWKPASVIRAQRLPISHCIFVQNLNKSLVSQSRIIPLRSQNCRISTENMHLEATGTAQVLKMLLGDDIFTTIHQMVLLLLRCQTCRLCRSKFFH